jgi:arabinogalactan endo-1,4-beta-galactosidase
MLLITSSSITQTGIPTTFAFSKVADVGWLSQMEATGYKFYDFGKSEEMLVALERMKVYGKAKGYTFVKIDKMR